MGRTQQRPEQTFATPVCSKQVPLPTHESLDMRQTATEPHPETSDAETNNSSTPIAEDNAA
jgi:hypothetical protein